MRNLFRLAAALVSAGEFGTAKPRVAYGLHHLPGALLSILMAAVAALLAARAAERAATLGLGQERRRLPGWAAGVVVVLVLLAVWLPAWWSGGFTMDDWRLLAAASVRQSVAVHPGLSWVSLDAVDGNFRPLGTVLYFGYMLHWFGVAARVFMLGPLVLVLASALVLYAIVRELGYGRGQGVAAAVLFGSRGLMYEVVTWTSALGDGIALCFCGLAVWLQLRALRGSGWRAAALQGAAWMSFVVAALGKQSAFCLPLILAALVYLRPGRLQPERRSRRLPAACAVLVVYGATAAGLFLHAKALAQRTSPYPIALSSLSVVHLLAYPCWYFVVFELPSRLGLEGLPAAAAGAALVSVAGGLLLAFGAPRGVRGRDLWFIAWSAAASLVLFAALPTRAAAYYGGMFAFWVSAGLGIVLLSVTGTEGVRRWGLWAVLALVWSGYAEVRLEQTGLLPSGGYTWGSYSSDTAREVWDSLHGQVERAPAGSTVVLAGCHDQFAYPAMAVLAGPQVARVLVENEPGGPYLANDLAGARAPDDRASLANPGAYAWTQPLSRARAAELERGAPVVTVTCPEVASRAGAAD